MKKKILIIDLHGGTTNAHKAIFEQLGFEVDALFCKHANTMKDNKKISTQIGRFFSLAVYLLFSAKMRFPILNFLSKATFGKLNIDKYRHGIFACIKNSGTHKNELFSQIDFSLLDKTLDSKHFQNKIASVDYLFCSFPPALVELTQYIANKYDKSIILNIAHRFNIWIKTPESNERIKKKILDLHNNPKHIVGVYSEYDYRYVEHYLKIKPHKLYLKPLYVPLRKKIKPKKNIILVGPVKLYNNASFFLNFLQKACPPPFTVKTIRAELGVFDDIGVMEDYAGIIIYPYSALSASEAELYQLNIPYFYPSVDFLQKNGLPNDYILHPIYCTKAQYKAMENDIDDPNSPNNYSDEATSKWLPYFSGYQLKNAIIFDSMEDLCEKIIEANKNFATISENMYTENKTERDKLLSKWQQLLR